MIHEASNRPPSSINDHVLIKVHQIVALERPLVWSARRLKHVQTYLIVLVYRSHSPLAFSLSDDFTRVFHNDLVGLECAVAANSVAAILCFNDLDTNVVLATDFGSVLKLFKAPIATVRAQPAIAIITLVQHVPILAIFVAASLLRTHTVGQVDMLVCAPYAPSISHKDV